LSVRNEEKQQQQKNKVEMGVILAKIWTGYLRNKSQKC
jgi:hypothetical protein